MLNDDEGLFWSTPKRETRGSGIDRKQAIIDRIRALTWDTSDYVQPEFYDPPAGLLALDFETDDPTLNTKGPAWAFEGVGQIIGMAVAWPGFKAYYPIRHVTGNVSTEKTLAWLAHQFKREDLKIVCANAAYDIGNAKREIGIYPAGGCEDVMFMAALIDEYRHSYSLESLSQSFLGYGKKTDVILDIMDRLNITKSDVMGALKYLPGPVVAPYAADDAANTLDLRPILYERMAREGLLYVHQLESDLIPMSVEMRWRGWRVDTDKAERLVKDIDGRRIPEIQAEIKRITGVHVEPWVADTCAAALRETGVTPKLTRKGAPQIDNELLSGLAPIVLNEDKEAVLNAEGSPIMKEGGNPVAFYIWRMRKMSKVSGTFLAGHILEHAHNGRLHSQINQLRSERDDGSGYGTVTGRYSVTDPGLQQIPVRDPEWGPIIRSCFLAEVGQKVASLDYSSQEPRLAVHFAAKTRVRNKQGDLVPIPGSIEAVEQYLANPRLDYHQMVADMAKIKRGSAKTLNLGLAYGMGGAKLARALGLPTEWMRLRKVGHRTLWEKIEPSDVQFNRSHGYEVYEVAGPEAKAIIKSWEEGAPFIRALFKVTSEVAETRGYIVTLSGRRCRFPRQGGGFGWTHKSMNRLCQSSAADQTKEGNRELWRAGFVPLMCVHDENVFSVDCESDAQKLAPYMIEAVKLSVPTVVDVKLGNDWGDIPK